MRRIAATVARGRYIERLGFFNPIATGGEDRLRVDLGRVDHWLAQGAQTVRARRGFAQAVPRRRRDRGLTSGDAPCGPAVSAKPDKLVTLGRISGLFGVKGWVKVQSYTEPRANIARFGVWIVRRRGVDRAFTVEHARGHGSGVVAKLLGIDDREDARAWIGAELAVERAALPACEPGEYYWADLEGLEVRTTNGEPLGARGPSARNRWRTTCWFSTAGRSG